MMLQNKHRSTSQVDRFGQVEEDGSANGMLMGILDAVDLRQIGNVLQKYDDLRSLKQVNVPDLSSSTPNSGVDAYQGEILDIDDRIDKMIRVIQAGKRDPRIRERVAKIVVDLAEKDDVAEIKAVFDYVREKVRFTSDIHNIETYQDPTTTFRYGIGDCDDYVIALASMYSSIGFPVRVKISADTSTSAGNKKAEWNHVWLQVGVPKINPQQWFDIDASVDKSVGWSIEQERKVAKTKVYELE